MNTILNHDLQNLITSADHSGLTNYVRLYQVEVLDQWTNTTHDGMEKFLRLSEQKISRAKRFLDQQSDWCQNAFSLGVAMGFVSTFRELLREEKKDQQIVAMCASQTEKTDRILLALASQNGGQGMRHRELADAVNIPYSSLTNIMKRVLQSRAVTATRSGKNTYYTLTKAGCRYCKKKQEYPSVVMEQFFPVYLRKMADDFESKYIAKHKAFIYTGAAAAIAPRGGVYETLLKRQLIMGSPQYKYAGSPKYKYGACESFEQKPREAAYWMMSQKLHSAAYYIDAV